MIFRSGIVFLVAASFWSLSGYAQQVNPSGATWTIQAQKLPVKNADFVESRSTALEGLAEFLSSQEALDADQVLNEIAASAPVPRQMTSAEIAALFCEEIDVTGFGSTAAVARGNFCLLENGPATTPISLSLENDVESNLLWQIYNVYGETSSVGAYIASLHAQAMLYGVKNDLVRPQEVVSALRSGISRNVWRRFLADEVTSEGLSLLRISVKTCVVPNAVTAITASTSPLSRVLGIDSELVLRNGDRRPNCSAIRQGPVFERSEFEREIGEFSFMTHFLFLQKMTRPLGGGVPYSVKAYEMIFGPFNVGRWGLWAETFGGVNADELRSPLFWKTALRIAP